MESLISANQFPSSSQSMSAKAESVVNSTQSEGAPQTEYADTNKTRSRDEGLSANLSSDSTDQGFVPVSNGRKSKGRSSDNNPDSITIGSGTSEPSADRMSSNKPTPTGGGRPVSRASSRGSAAGKDPNAGRRSYRNTYSGNNRMQMQSSSAPRPFARAGPLSYSKAVRLSGNGSPLFAAREVDEKTRAVISDMNEFESAQLMTEDIATDIFAPGTGISDDEIRKIMRVRVSSKQMELEQQVAAGNKVIKRLKDTLTALTKGKNEYIHRAIDAEKQARNGWAQALETAQLLDEDRGFFKQKVKQLEVDNTIWKDNAKDTMRELSLSEDKMQNLRNEIEELKVKLSQAENAGTKALISLEVEKARIQEYEKMKADWKSVGKGGMSSEDEAEMKRKVAEQTEKYKEAIRAKDERIRELENEIVLAENQFARAVADSEAAANRVSSKDKDMQDLMASITEIQAAGQRREEEANRQRKEAEHKVSELEKTLAITKGELNVFNHERSTLKDTLDSARKERSAALKAVDDMKFQVDELKTDLNATMSQLTLEKELRARSEQKEREERNERIALSAQMVAMAKEHAQLESRVKDSNDTIEKNWAKQIEDEQKKLAVKEKEIKQAQEKISGLQGEIEALRDSLKKEKDNVQAGNIEEIAKLKSEVAILKEKLKTKEMEARMSNAATEEKVQELEKAVREGQAERRRMHNLIQELRGNVRVYARIRPFLPGDGDGYEDEEPMCVPKSEVGLKLTTDPNDRKSYSFEFDKVFGPSIGQEQVFTEVSEFVQSALDGYNVCLFSYGQTGSGKTHTMQGSGNDQMRGIIPRAIEQVGAYKDQLEKDGWQYDMQVTFVEIYNETIRDLLRDEEYSDAKHEIKVGPDGRRFITDVNMVPLEPSDKVAVEEVMRQAAKYRSVGSTDMNAVSSRSHSVFTLHLTALHPENRQALRGTLNLCDLAGSERLDRSNATGDRQKETVAINKSLSALTSVFVAIGKKASHIPFRDSKLTYLLQPSLSGDGKTLMLVNLSPTQESTSETLCSLRFASQVNKCELGKAKRSLESVDDEDASSISSSMAGSRNRSLKSPPGRTPSKISSASSSGKKPIRR